MVIIPIIQVQHSTENYRLKVSNKAFLIKLNQKGEALQARYRTSGIEMYPIIL